MSRTVTSLATAGALALALTAAPVAAASDSMSSPTPLVSGALWHEDTTSYTTEGFEQNTVAPLTTGAGSASRAPRAVG